MMYRLLFSLIAALLLTISTITYAGPDLIKEDSVFSSIEKQNISELEKAEAYINFASFHSVSKPRLSILSLNKALEIFTANNDQIKAANVYGFLASIHSQLGLFQIAVEYYFKAYHIFIRSDEKTALAWLLTDIGNLYFKAKRYNIAYYLYQKSLYYFNQTKFYFGISVVYLNYGLIKEYLNENDAALVYFNKSLNTRKKINEPYLTAHIYSYIARIHLKKNEYKESEMLLKKSLDIIFNISQKMDLHLLQINKDYLLLADLYKKQLDNNTALFYADSALYYAQINTDTTTIISTYLYIGDLYEKMGLTTNALQQYEKAMDLSEKQENYETQSSIILKLLKINTNENNKNISISLLNNYEITLEKIKNNNDIIKYESFVLAIETYYKNAELDSFKEKEELNKYIITLLTVFVILVLFFASLIYYFKNRLWKSNKELINTAYEGIVLHQQGIIYDVNESFVKFSGYSYKELKKKSVFDLLDFEIFDIIKQNISEDKNAHYITKMKMKNETFVDIEAESRPFVYLGKKMRLVTVKDISEQTKANAQIHLFKTIIEQNYSTVVITDTHGNIEYVNPSFTQMTGYSLDEAIGKNPRILKSDLYDNDFYQNLWENISSGKPWNGIFKNIDKNGHFFWEEANITPIKDNNGNIIKYVAIKQDITNRKELNEKIKQYNEQFKKIFESIDAFVFVIDFETENIISANLKTKLSFGQVEQKNFKNIIFNGDKDAVFNFPKDLLIQDENVSANDREIIKEEVFLKSKNSWYDFNMRMIPWVDDIKAILIVANDITDRKNTILSLNELNATKDKFFSIISHDLKNPFQGLLGFSEILLNDFDYNDTKNLKMMLSHINNISKTSYRLLENLLEWANLQKGLTPIVLENIKLIDAVHQTVALKEPFYSQKNINLKIQIPSNLEVFSDKHVLSTVLRNFLSNAIKFTPQNGEIIIFAEENSNEVIIGVNDNGVGIPKEMIPKLFRIDTKYSVVGTQGEIGNGLGLILCKEFINKIGGRIYAESKLDEGSTFFFTVGKANKNL